MIEIILTETQRGYMRTFFQGRERSLEATLSAVGCTAPEREAAELIAAICDGVYETGVGPVAEEKENAAGVAEVKVEGAETDTEPETKTPGETSPAEHNPYPAPPPPGPPAPTGPLKHNWVPSRELLWPEGTAPSEGSIQACSACLHLWGEAPPGPCPGPGPSTEPAPKNPLDNL